MAKTRIYGSDGRLARVFGENYQERSQQIALSKLINKGISTNSTVVVEAPTGVGKSLGVTIPMAHRLHVKKETRQFIIVTVTKALQDQYMNKELPLLKQQLGYEFSYASLKGKSNYACLLKVSEELKRNNLAVQWLKSWMIKTVYGELEHLSAEEQLHLHTLDIRCTTEECLQKKCPYYDQCLFYKAKLNAWFSNILVVNYHVFLANMELFEETGQHLLLPPVSNVLFDEAHVIKDLFRDFFCYSMSRTGIERVVKYLEKRYPECATRLTRSAKRLFAFFDQWVGGVGTRLIFEINRKQFRDYYEPFRLRLVQSADLVSRDVAHYLSVLGADSSGSKTLLYAKKISKQIQNSLDLMEKVENLMSDGEGNFAETNLTVWVDKQGNNTGISAKPIEISRFFSGILSKVTTQSTFMSATLPLDSTIRDLGLENLPGKIIKKKLTEVFDYKTSSGLFIADVGEDPNTPAFDKNVGDLICRVISLVGGGILALFTSFRALEVAADLVGDLSPNILRQPPLIQRSGDNVNYLIREFSKGGRVLLGSRSFFQGVDFPGDVCQVVIINQIPFKHFGDPVIQAMQFFNKPSWFAREQIPHAVVLFKQAFGRLIRTEHDKGLVITCDHRIISKNYGQIIIGSLPSELPVFTGWEEFLEKLENLTSYEGDH